LSKRLAKEEADDLRVEAIAAKLEERYQEDIRMKSALPDPGIMPGGIRDRASQAVLARGQQPEDKEKTRRSKEYWAKYRAERVKRTDTAGAGIITPPPQGRPIADEVIAEAGPPHSRRRTRKLYDLTPPEPTMGRLQQGVANERLRS
jgi:hypothetical protein